MESNKKTVFIIGGVIVVIFIGIIAFFTNKSPAKNTNYETLSTTANETPVPTATIAAGVANFWFDKESHKVTFTNLPAGTTMKFELASENESKTISTVSMNDTPDSVIIEYQGKKLFTVGINWATTDEGFAIGSTKSVKNSAIGNLYRVSGKDYTFDTQTQYLPSKSVVLSGSCTVFNDETIAAPCRNGNSQFEIVDGAKSIQYGLYCENKNTDMLSICDSIASGVKLE